MSRPTITTDATGRCEADPDLATVEITAVREGDTATIARRNASECAETVRESLVAEGVSPDLIRTVSVQVEDASQLFDCDGEDPYRATERLVVECVPETAGDALVVATDAGASVPTVQFHLHETVRQSLEEEALAAAMDRARGKAERIAASEDKEVAGVREVTTGETSRGMESIVDEALAGTSDGDFCPDPITVSETVEVVYELTPE